PAGAYLPGSPRSPPAGSSPSTGRGGRPAAGSAERSPALRWRLSAKQERTALRLAVIGSGSGGVIRGIDDCPDLGHHAAHHHLDTLLEGHLRGRTALTSAAH